MTAVEWLVSEMPTAFKELTINKELIKQAKEMEKQQIIETARFYFHERGKATPEQYYNQEFGGNNEQQ